MNHKKERFFVGDVVFCGCPGYHDVAVGRIIEEHPLIARYKSHYAFHVDAPYFVRIGQEDILVPYVKPFDAQYVGKSWEDIPDGIGMPKRTTNLVQSLIYSNVPSMDQIRFKLRDFDDDYSRAEYIFALLNNNEVEKK